MCSVFSVVLLVSDGDVSGVRNPGEGGMYTGATGVCGTYCFVAQSSSLCWNSSQSDEYDHRLRGSCAIVSGDGGARDVVSHRLVSFES